MNPFRFKICLVILLAAVVYAACKKMDQPADLKKPLTNEERFFSAHASNDPTVQAAAGFMKKLNDKYQFTEKTIAQIGFPRWDKAMVLQDNKPSATGRALSGNDSTVVIIPFVRETQSVVNAALRVCMREADTSYRYLCDWQYEDSLQTGRSPKEAALLLMMMDKEVFGNRVFSITDRSLFGDKGAAVKITTINSTPSFTNLMSAFTVCYSVYEDMYEGQVHGCEPGDDNCTEYREVRFCIDITPDIGTDPGGDTNPPAGDPGGGSGGGGGNEGPPPPPCETTALKASLQNNCGPGWVPIDDPVTNPPQQDPVDSILKSYSRVIKDTAIYIYDNLSKPRNVEFAFTGIQFNNSIVVIQRKTDNDSTNVVPEVMINNLILLFTWHSHVSTSLDITVRGSFSPMDIYMLSNVRCLKQNFVSFADCRNKRYALVITDLAKAKAFFDANDYNDIYLNHTTNTSGNTQELDERSIINVIKGRSVNGISFYVSNDAPGFQSWSLLNR